jgi:GH25 family lysozyme M1 (1,4-beta-N-acetylmuramidase)/predicted secreted protein
MQTRGSANILFIDFSAYQTIVDQNLLISKLAGKGAYLRAFGTDHSARDANFLDRVALLKANGILSGAYYFATPTTDPAVDKSEIYAQADQFIAALQAAYGTGQYGDLIPMLDVEAWGAHPKDYGITGAMLADWVVEFKNYFFTKTNRRLGFYSNRDFLTNATDWMGMTAADLDKLKSMPLWLAEYDEWYPANTADTASPANLGGWSVYAAWQYTDKEPASNWGLSHATNQVDINRTDSFDRLIPCPPPINVLVTQTGDNLINVQWDKPNVIDYLGADIYINGVWKKYQSEQTPVTQSVDIDVSAYTDYSTLEFQVVAQDDTNDFGYSQKKNLSLKATLAESELSILATAAMGTSLKKGTTLLASLTSIDGLSISADTIETTTLDATSSYRSFISSLKDAGEVGLSGYFVYSAHSTVLADFEAGTVQTYTIEFPDKVATSGTKWTFSAVVTALSTGAALEDLVTFEATLKVSGKPTLVAPV